MESNLNKKSLFHVSDNGIIEAIVFIFVLALFLGIGRALLLILFPINNYPAIIIQSNSSINTKYNDCMHQSQLDYYNCHDKCLKLNNSLDSISCDSKCLNDHDKQDLLCKINN